MQTESWVKLSLIFAGYMLGRIHYFDDGRYKGFFFVFFNRAITIGFYDTKWRESLKSKKFLSKSDGIPFYKLEWKKMGGL